MFRSKTVIIVGAGASSEFGLPTGAQIFKSALELPVRADPRDSRISGFSFDNGFDKYLMEQRGSQLWTQYEGFVARVNNSAYPSIDRLAWVNQDISGVCRAYSAWSILKEMYECQRESFQNYGRVLQRDTYTKSKKHLRPMVKEWPNWIAATVNKWIGDAEAKDNLKPDLLTFVTFNYDRLIEESFEHFISFSNRFAGIQSSELPLVHHVHGAFPAMPEQLTEQFLLQSQESIKYIEDGGDQTALADARRAIDDAEHVICIGFDFDPKNAELIGLPQNPRKLQVLNYDGNEALQNRAISFGVTPQQILSGTFVDRMSASNAVNRGFLDRAELLGSSKTAFVGLSKGRKAPN